MTAITRGLVSSSCTAATTDYSSGARRECGKCTCIIKCKKLYKYERDICLKMDI